MTPWRPDRVVDEALAARVIAAQLPELAGLPVTHLASGWDNAVHRVGPDLVFRFVQRAIAVPGAVRETAVLRALAGRLPLPVPRPRYLGGPTPDVPWPWWGGPYLPGTELVAAGLPEHARVPLATALGGFLRVLHDPALRRDVELAVAADGVTLPVDPIRRADPVSVAERARGRLAALRDTGLPSARLDALLADAAAVGAAEGEPVLVHGDLHLRHVLVHDDGSAAGVIDWGDTALGHPSTDLMIAWTGFTGEARRALLEAYGPVDGATALRARAVGVHVCLALADQHSQEGGDPRVLAELLTALGRVLET